MGEIQRQKQTWCLQVQQGRPTESLKHPSSLPNMWRRDASIAFSSYRVQVCVFVVLVDTCMKMSNHLLSNQGISDTSISIDASLMSRNAVTQRQYSQELMRNLHRTWISDDPLLPFGCSFVLQFGACILGKWEKRKDQYRFLTGRHYKNLRYVSNLNLGRGFLFILRLVIGAAAATVAGLWRKEPAYILSQEQKVQWDGLYLPRFRKRDSTEQFIVWSNAWHHC